MNYAIMSKLKPEYQVLYKMSKTKRLEACLHGVLREEIQMAKRRITRGEDDKLADKLEQYGNKGSWGITKMRELERIIFRDKGPDNSELGQWVSVEIECVMPGENALKAFVKYCRAKGYSKYVTVKTDGSINANPDGDEEGCGDEDCDCNSEHSRAIGREIVVTFRYGDWAMLGGICAKLSELHCSVNKSCGLHVHFDCRDKTARSVTTLAKRIALCVPALKQMLPKSRQNNQFCANTINGHRNGPRYSFVNVQSYKKHQTLEVRGHSGTIDAVKIVNWIRLINLLMNKRNSEAVNTVPELLAKYTLEADLKEYVMERFNKFKGTVERTGVDDVSQDHETPRHPELDLGTLADAVRVFVDEGIPSFEEQIRNLRAS